MARISSSCTCGNSLDETLCLFENALEQSRVPVKALCDYAKQMPAKVHEIKDSQEFVRYTKRVDQILTALISYGNTLAMDVNCSDNHESLHTLVKTVECLMECRKEALFRVE